MITMRMNREEEDMSEAYSQTLAMNDVTVNDNNENE